MTRIGVTITAASDICHDSVNMTTRMMANLTTLPAASGNIARSPWTMLRSEIERETTCPVRMLS